MSIYIDMLADIAQIGMASAAIVAAGIAWHRRTFVRRDGKSEEKNE
ncbi:MULTISPECIES: hypothetical protein [Sphingomonadaceae]|nr:hypothetical protein [Sphingobium sp. 3R8]MBZ9649211.1 hypothetical protein [Sphingobium sp. 3R8]